MPGLLVNDGCGVNQIVYILAKLLRSDVHTLLIEEPEVHLHPTALRNLARHLCTIVREENKQIILTTHSELLISCLIAAVADRMLSSEEIRCYLCPKEHRSTILQSQQVRENGQIEGVLSNLVEAELEDLQKLLGIKERGIMSRFVFDEWVWADLNGENGENAQKKTYQLLQSIFHRCDQLVTVSGSKFVPKFLRMMSRPGTMAKRKIVTVLKT